MKQLEINANPAEIAGRPVSRCSYPCGMVAHEGPHFNNVI
jgi:hypothetical protein